MLPFTKAQAVGNDFLIVESSDLGRLGLTDWPALAREMCDLHYGIGADGLEVLLPDSHLRIFNSDGSEAEISGNGTRCVAAYLVVNGRVGREFTLTTTAGPKKLVLLEDQSPEFKFSMMMGEPGPERELDTSIELTDGSRAVTILNVGNPQCVVFVNDFELDWRRLGAEIEGHARFPARTNVSFVRVLDRGTIDVRFWERGPGETQSSGTGSTGAAAASILTGRTDREVVVQTPAGPIEISWEDEIELRGPATLIARGEYHLRQNPVA